MYTYFKNFSKSKSSSLVWATGAAWAGGASFLARGHATTAAAVPKVAIESCSVSQSIFYKSKAN